jgi:acetyl-CoA carboxylase biotin carboxyl carrier protein
MSTTDKSDTSPDRAMIESVWAEARDLIRRLEGSTVQRFAVAAGEYRIEIERGAAMPTAPAAGAEPLLPSAQPIATRTGSGFGVATGARMASGAFTLQPMVDNRIPVLAPLVGTFYGAPKPGEKPFVAVGDTVDAGQRVCIVEAMKMMNEVVASEAGKVVEVAASDGEWVEFEQVLMYLEPAES